MEERLLRRNLELISSVARRARVDIILAFKAFALWKTFPIFREYISSTTASSLWEARLAFERFGAPAHTYSPAYKDEEIEAIARMSSHLTFNSLGQYRRFAAKARAANPGLRLGLRINPEHSEVATLLYNPCAPGTRFGVSADGLPDELPEGLTGFHCHCHCESSAEEFGRTIDVIEARFGPWLDRLEWLNFGGGHLMTRADYNVDLLVSLLFGFHRRHPRLRLIMEPGSAFAWQTGPLVASVVDVVADKGIKTAVLDMSFTCHAPDCLEMPYHPAVRGAELRLLEEADRPLTYRLGGNSCLSGDFMGSWRFDHELEPGERLYFEDMIHYTTVKTTMFNGIRHPSIALLRCDGQLEMLREYSYEDYLNRMD